MNPIKRLAISLKKEKDECDKLGIPLYDAYTLHFIKVLTSSDLSLSYHDRIRMILIRFLDRMRWRKGE